MKNDEPNTSPIMAMYWRQIHNIMRQINDLALEHGDPREIIVTAKFRDHTISHDVRIFPPRDEE